VQNQSQAKMLDISQQQIDVAIFLGRSVQQCSSIFETNPPQMGLNKVKMTTLEAVLALQGME